MTVQQTFDLALRQHQSGQLAEAEKLYRQILSRQPNHVDALHLLGVVALQTGHVDAAIDLLQRALAMKSNWPEALSNLGNALKCAGRLDQAAEAFQKAIALRPSYAEAHSNLGVVLKAQGKLDEAISCLQAALATRPDSPETLGNLANALAEKRIWDQAIAAYRRAIALRPDFPDALVYLGNCLRQTGELAQSIAACQKAIELRPAYPDAFCGLGTALKDSGKLDQAIDAYRRAIALKPDFAEAYSNLGVALSEKKQNEQAIAACSEAVRLKPDDYQFQSNLGVVLGNAGLLDQAVACHRAAVALKPDSAEVHNNLGNAFRETGDLAQAIAETRIAIELRPDFADAHANLAGALLDNRDPDSAITSYQKAIALKPDFSDAWLGLGNALKEVGQLDEAIAAYRQAVELDPGNRDAQGNLIYTLHFHPDYDSRRIAEEHKVWQRQHAESLKVFHQPHSNDRSPGRRLRIGYVSPDFRGHPVGRFLFPLLTNHDKTQVEVFAYANVKAPDPLTDAFRSRIDCWRDTRTLSDEQLANLIRQDKIDILVDLAMHLEGNRLLVFARKPAQVQVTYLAYCSTTGLQAMDYRLSDPWIDPPGDDESIYTEQTIRLADTYWCYPHTVDTAEITSPPAITSGHVTFGTLNNFCKVSKASLATWAELMRAMPASRLILHSMQGNHRQRLLDRMQQRGVEPGRIEFIGRLPPVEYFAVYGRIDIALDTFPHAGGTTTCDALWMGVPVVTLAGRTAAGRGGVSILSNMGLPELIAYSREQYVRIAVDLASDLPRLGELRSTLRQRMLASPLMDAPRFARSVEAAYRQVWSKWRERK